MPVKTILRANKINKIAAILNGTTNYILTKMAEKELSYEILENIIYYGLPTVLHSVEKGVFRKRGKQA